MIRGWSTKDSPVSLPAIGTERIAVEEGRGEPILSKECKKEMEHVQLLPGRNDGSIFMCFSSHLVTC